MLVRYQRGFNIIELVVVMLIVAIAAAIALPSFRALIENAQTRNVASSYISGLQLARSEAIQRSALVQFAYDENDNSWSVGCVNANNDCPETITEKAANQGGGENVEVVVVGGNNAIFNSLGNLSSTNNDPITSLDVTNTAIPADDAKKLRVEVGATGNTKLCDIDVTDVNDPKKCE